MGKHGSSVGDVVVEPVVAVCDVDNPVVGAFVVGGKCGKGSSSLPGLPDSPRAVVKIKSEQWNKESL
jgi:hypothetical protein